MAEQYEEEFQGDQFAGKDKTDMFYFVAKYKLKGCNIKSIHDVALNQILCYKCIEVEDICLYRKPTK